MKSGGCVTRFKKRFSPLAAALPLLAVLVLSTPVQAQPLITITPTSGAIGTKVTIDGTNFGSWAGNNLTISFDGADIPSSPLKVSDTGTFTTEFTIPGDAAPGRHWFTVKSEVGTATLEIKNFFIVEEAFIKLDLVDGPVGTRVIISGRGFYANGTVTFHYYNVIGEKLGSETTSPTGEFNYQFTVPNSLAGEHKITAMNVEGNSMEARFVVIPSIALNHASAGPGELLTVRGNGFGSRIEVGIDFGTYPVAKARTDEYGNFEVEFNVPEVRPNPYDVRVKDKNGNTDKAGFTVTAGARLDQTEGSVGSKVNIHGSGFKPGATVALDYDNLRVGAATTDNNGSFTITFNVPSSVGGDHVITVTDGETTKRFAFTMESQDPAAPGQLLPANNSETRARAYLDWQDVTDPSMPVVYSLQVASDQNFASLVLEKSGLADSEYTLTEKEQLAAIKGHTPYYWRVKAFDSAGNESEWSNPWIFYVSGPPVPRLVLPPTGTLSQVPVLFNWQGVTSLSPPTTYSLQVATDLNFTSRVLEKIGLIDSAYTLTGESALPVATEEAPYYWRVKATDSARNESEWSDPWTFYTQTPFHFPGWATYTLIGIGVIVIGFLTFWIGRRTAFRDTPL